MNLLPHSLDAERGILGSFFISPKEVGNICAEKKITPAHFHIPANAIIFSLLQELWAKGDPFDITTATQILADRRLLQDAGGAANISDIFINTPTAAFVGNYIAIVQEKLVLRQIIRVCENYAGKCYGDQDDPESLLIGAQSEINAISFDQSVARKPFQVLLTDALDSIANGEDASADILSGLSDLDEVVRMRRGNFIVVAGEAKSGKTALAGTIATNAAVHQGRRVALISLEMTDMEIVKRMISAAGRLNLAMCGRHPSEAEMSGINRALIALNKKDVEVVADAYDFASVCASLRQLHAKKPLDLAVVDYIQIIEHSTGRKGELRHEVVAQVSRTLKRLAGELNCVVIGLSQVNEDGKLRESRAIGQDANAIIAVEHSEDGGRIIRVVAQRSGQSNRVVEAQWLPQFTKFEDKL